MARRQIPERRAYAPALCCLEGKLSEIHEPHREGKAFEAFLSDLDLGQWLTKAQFKALYVLDNRMLNIADDYGFTYRGFSWRPGAPYGTLCLKTSFEGCSYVCFVAATSFSKATNILLRKLSGGTIAWKVDKYA